MPQFDGTEMVKNGDIMVKGLWPEAGPSQAQRRQLALNGVCTTRAGNWRRCKFCETLYQDSMRDHCSASSE